MVSLIPLRANPKISRKTMGEEGKRERGKSNIASLASCTYRPTHYNFFFFAVSPSPF